MHHFYAYITGAYPQGLVRDSAGNLYGATLEGGGATQCLNGCGTVFKLDTAGVFTVLYTFHNGSADGKSPSGRLIRDPNGIIHGVIVGLYFGWIPTVTKLRCMCFLALGAGTGLLPACWTWAARSTEQPSVAAISPLAWTVAASFSKLGRQAVGADGSIYGATWWGGTGTGCSVGSTLGCGTIFKYTP